MSSYNSVLSRYYALSVFVGTIIITSLSNHLLISGLEINDYPGEYQKDEYISYILYLFIEAIQRALEFLILSILILLSTKINIYSDLNKIVNNFFLFLIISPLLFFVDLIEVFAFTVMVQYMQLSNRVVIGTIMLFILLVYYISIYIIVINIS